MNEGTLIIVIEVAIVLLATYLIHYTRQKGKNQADKEDLRKMTEVVEEVKQRYTEDNELLRANLNLLTSKKNIIFSEEKECIIQYFGQLNKWIWDGLNVQILEFNHTNYQELAERLIRMRDDHNQTNIAFSKVQLLIKDDDLVLAGHEANMKTLALHQFKEGIIQRLQKLLSWEKSMVDDITSKDFSWERQSDHMREYYQKEAKENAIEKKSIVDGYFKDNGNYFSPAIAERNRFKDLAKNYINKDL